MTPPPDRQSSAGAQAATARQVRWWSLRDWLAPDDLLRQALYRRLWLSVFISSFGSQITMLALPLAAVVLLHATPTQMGWLTAMELAPFALFSLPAGVWLDRMRKLPVYVTGEAFVAFALASVPAAWALGVLGMPFLYAIAFLIGTVGVIAGSAAQIVLTQIVPRPRLVEAHAKNALAGSFAEVTGPGAAGALIRLVGAPLALLANAAIIGLSVTILRGLRIEEPPHALVGGTFRAALHEGLKFVAGKRLLRVMAAVVGGWQLCNQMATVVQILFATRELGLDERELGLCFVGLGFGTVTAGVFGNRLSARIGVGACLLLGFALTGFGWLQAALTPAHPFGVASFVLMLVCFGCGAVLIFINFLALRQAVTPRPLLGRMTSTMRWLILLPAPVGALLGGWLGEHAGLRWALGTGGASCLLLAAAAFAFTGLRRVRKLPAPA
ncbi:MAG: MFS transporter [Ramlibacter sp.]